MKQLLFFLATAFVVITVTCSDQTEKTTPTKDTELTYSNLSVEQFKAKMKESNAALLDVRTPGEIADGKIEGALEIDFNASDFRQKIQELDQDKTFLVYCQSGGRSSKTCKLMSELGFKGLYNLEDGYSAWSK